MRDYDIAVFEGDGIGPEIMASAIAAIDILEGRFGFVLKRRHWRGGAAYYREHGVDLEPGAFEAARAADAILFASMGLPDVRFPDGTEIAPHLNMRAEFGLFAGVRPVRKFPNTPQMLADSRAETLDFVVLRESTEGLFASRGKGTLQDDAVATDTMVITRATCEKLFDFALDLARRRKDKGRSAGRVTCVDKSNVFVSMAFFRKVFEERARAAGDLATDCAYVDAAALDLVRKPWTFDVMVMENMFGDILSDLGGGLVGGMGMAPCGEIGLEHALFQPAHGTAPDIAGQDKANPTAMLLSMAMMLDWLGARHGDERLVAAGEAVEAAVWAAYEDKALQPMEFGGTTGLRDATRAVLDRLQ